jgi:hypothetical protein
MKNEEWRRKRQHGQGTFLPLQVVVYSSLFVLRSSFLCLGLLCVLCVSVVHILLDTLRPKLAGRNHS